jgi:hypothetical protein
MRSAIVGGLFSILMMSSAAHALPMNIALNQPVTSSSENNAYGYTFVAGAVTDGKSGDTQPGGIYSYWIAQDGVTSAFVTIDLGATYNITGLTVEDTHNQTYFDRGTNAFAIGFGGTALAAQNSASSSPVTTGAFSVSDWKSLTDVSITAAGTGRFVTFLALSSYSNSPGDSTGNGTASPSTMSVGLNEIQVFGTLPNAAVPEPISMVLLGSGLLGLIALRRRSV